LNQGKTRKRATKQRCEKNSRGDWTPLELFVAGVRGWEGHLRKQVRNGSPFLE
jgi:hypothetical protein